MKQLKLALIVGINIMLSLPAFAVDGTVEATAGFRLALTISQTQPLAFTATGPRIEFTGIPAGSDVLRVFTNGTRTEAGGYFILAGNPGTATPGILRLTGSPAETVNIGCDDVATLSRGAGQNIILSDIEINTAGGVGVDATDCDASGITSVVVASYAIGGGGSSDVHIGGRIVATSGDGVSTGIYSTANTGTGGDPVTLRVLYN